MEYEFTLSAIGTLTIPSSSAKAAALPWRTRLKRNLVRILFKRFLDWLNSGAPEAPTPPPPTKQKPEPTPEAEQKQPLSLEEAYKIKNRDGLEYGNIATETLQVMLLGIRKALNNPDVSADDKAEYLKKQSA
jgi:hypothetical protein